MNTLNMKRSYTGRTLWNAEDNACLKSLMHMKVLNQLVVYVVIYVHIIAFVLHACFEFECLLYIANKF